MLRRSVKKERRIAELQYCHIMSCCGNNLSFEGPTPEKIMYICKDCRQEMIPKTEEVRTREAAELIVGNQRAFNEECPDCGAKSGHHVVQDTKGDCTSAYFLRCGSCGTELREINKEELL